MVSNIRHQHRCNHTEKWTAQGFSERLFLLFTSICPPRKILILWSLKISPCILKCSGIFKLSDLFEFSLLPGSWFAGFSWFSSTIKDGYNSSVDHISATNLPKLSAEISSRLLARFSIHSLVKNELNISFIIHHIWIISYNMI